MVLLLCTFCFHLYLCLPEVYHFFFFFLAIRPTVDMIWKAEALGSTKVCYVEVRYYFTVKALTDCH